MEIKKLTIIIPAYNEAATIEQCIKRVIKVKSPGIEKEIIIINDGSKDKTFDKLSTLKDKGIKIINKHINQGKGSGIRDAIKIATGDVFIIQDADLEYNPTEIIKLIKPIKDGLADVVYGSRFMGGEAHRVLLFWHMIGNKFLTLLSNSLTNLDLTDMETCYKMFTKEVARKLDIKENRFGFEPEFTVKIARMEARVYEMGISYSGRNYAEGKKINWSDGLYAVWCLIKYGILE
ncbi:MAG: glycosyltransferase family 2 protein [Candidatus Microgenomates bacterium]|jgi:glycosyltransferase involved in cell wall biosynthesis